MSGKGCNHSTVGAFCVAFKVSGLFFFSLTGKLNQNQDTYSYESPVEPHNLTFTIKKKKKVQRCSDMRTATSHGIYISGTSVHRSPSSVKCRTDTQSDNRRATHAPQLAPVFGPCNLARLASSSISSIIRSWETEKNV